MKRVYSLGVFNKIIIIPLALVGYEIVIANSALLASLGISNLISNVGSWNNCLIECDCGCVALERKKKNIDFCLGNKYYLLTESEVVTGKSQTEALMY